MGQRTQIVIQSVDKSGVTTNKVYHLQWGNGRIMPLHLMRLFMKDYFKDIFENNYNIANRADISDGIKIHDITNEAMFPDNFNIKNIKQVKELFKHFDNNNGGMVIRINENDPTYKPWDYLVGFVLGHEECWDYVNKVDIEESFSRFVSWKEYFEKVGGKYCQDKDFLRMWNGFIKFVGIKFIRPTRVKKENV